MRPGGNSREEVGMEHGDVGVGEEWPGAADVAPGEPHVAARMVGRVVDEDEMRRARARVRRDRLRHGRSRA